MTEEMLELSSFKCPKCDVRNLQYIGDKLATRCVSCKAFVIRRNDKVEVYDVAGNISKAKRKPIKLWYTLSGVGVDGKPVQPAVAAENEYFLNNDLYLICAELSGVSEVMLMDDCATIYLGYKKHLQQWSPKQFEDAKQFIRNNKQKNVTIVPIGRREYVVTHE